MTQVAEAYFHLKRVEITPSKLRQLGDLTAEIAAEAASGLFPQDSVIDIRLSEGSLKGWAMVTTTSLLLGTYGVIADYKGFKESINEINSDAKWFGNQVIDKFTSKSDLKTGYVYRKERRTKTPGRIKRLIEKQEWLEEHKSQLPPHAVEEEMAEIDRLLMVILSDLPPVDQEHLKAIILGSSKPRPPSDKARAVSASPDTQQLTMLPADTGGSQAQIPDYLQRFRLADGPRLLGPNHGRAAQLIRKKP